MKDVVACSLRAKQDIYHTVVHSIDLKTTFLFTQRFRHFFRLRSFQIPSNFATFFFNFLITFVLKLFECIMATYFFCSSPANIPTIVLDGQRCFPKTSANVLLHVVKLTARVSISKEDDESGK